MNPDKLFDYLDGNLSESERQSLEAQIAGNPQLQRELAVARAIHKGMRHSREVVGVTIDPASREGAPLGRKIATAFAVLVGLNVAIGLYFIGVFETKKKNVERNEAATRAQLQKSLEKAARDTLPKLRIESDDINLTAPAGGGDAFAEKIIAAAAKVGGSAVKAPPQENDKLVVLAEIPGDRLNDFRHEIGVPPASVPIGSPSPTAEKKIIQFRISENQKPAEH